MYSQEKKRLFGWKS